MKSGFVTILGRPNAGKSTLLNSLLGQKLAIATAKAQTTRNSILGVLNENDCQIVFTDTPGIHEASTALGVYMNKEAMSQADGADIIYYIIDGNKGLQDEDNKVLDKIFKYDIPVFLLVNKIDEMNKDRLISRLSFASNSYKFAEIIPISALNKENFAELLETSKKYFKDEVQYYPNDYKTNMNIEFQISEIIREKMILNLDREVPHLTAVKIDSLKDKTSKVFIEATIVCNKQSHKGIIIGSGGKMLKKINEQASKDIAAIFDNKKIYLSLFVKVVEDWQNSSKQLFDLGYFKGDKDEW